MPDDGVSSYVEERLEQRVNAMLSDTVVGTPTLGTSRESGLKRVPLDGPPTYGKSELKVFSNGVRSLRG